MSEKLIKYDFNVGHRERLKQKFKNSDDAFLEDYELLELLLFYALPRVDVKKIAKQLLKSHKSLTGVLNADEDELLETKGIGPNAVTIIKLVNSLHKRSLRNQIINKNIFENWNKIVDYCKVSMAHKKVEQLRILYLDHKNQLIEDELQQEGSVNGLPIFVRKIAKKSLILEASGLILVHNHPSGDPTPSKQDIDLTRNLLSTLATLDITLYDHLIIGKSGIISFKSDGII